MTSDDDLTEYDEYPEATVVPYERFESREIDKDYNVEARTADRQRDIYGTKRVARPSYTLPDPVGTTRIVNAKPGYDRVTFPIMRKNSISKLGEDQLESPEGSLFQLQRLIADARFDLLRQCINSGVHMVSDITAEVVVRCEAAVLTDKAGTVTKVKPHVTEVSILTPNGEFQFGGTPHDAHPDQGEQAQRREDRALPPRDH